MKNEVEMNELLKMTIGDINRLEKGQMIINGVIEKQREFVKYHIEQQDIQEQWAEEFIGSMK